VIDDPLPLRALAGVVKLTLNARLAALLLTVLWLPEIEPDDLATVTGLLAVVGVTSITPILLWDRIGSWLLRHPSWTLVDLLAAIAVLSLVGLETPFVLFVLSTALVGGVLYGWWGAIALGLALIGAYSAGAMLGDVQPSLAELLGTPVLVPVAGIAGAAVRGLVVRQHQASQALAEAAMADAAGSERTRLAREMHDTLAKTLHGIALSATAVGQQQGEAHGGRATPAVQRSGDEGRRHDEQAEGGVEPDGRQDRDREDQVGQQRRRVIQDPAADAVPRHDRDHRGQADRGQQPGDDRQGRGVGRRQPQDGEEQRHQAEVQPELDQSFEGASQPVTVTHRATPRGRYRLTGRTLPRP
jgi:hypothetical protein